MLDKGATPVLREHAAVVASLMNQGYAEWENGVVDADDADTLDLLLNYKPDINVRNTDGLSGLTVAANQTT